MEQRIHEAIAAIDAALSKQLAAILHHPEFQKLEGSWRGLHYLVSNGELGREVMIRVLNATKREVGRDLERAVDVEDSLLIRRFYWRQHGSTGETHFFAAIVCDYPFTHHPDDVALLRRLSAVGAATHCLFLGTASHEMFGLKTWDELAEVRNLGGVFNRVEYIEWNAFRRSDESRYVVLTVPRTLARLPYGHNTRSIEEFAFEELERDEQGTPTVQPADYFTWMSTAYLLLANLTATFARAGLITWIPSNDAGGGFRNLPVYHFKSDHGETDPKCPTEVYLSACGRHFTVLQKLGFVPLAHQERTDYSEFFGAGSTHEPKFYPGKNGAIATENAWIAARLPFLLTTARFMHYLARIAVDLAPPLGREDRERWLNRWILKYVNAQEEADPEARARHPLREAAVKLHEVPGRPGMTRLEAHLRPWLRFETLQSSVRLTTTVPAS